ncbi:MAG: phosphate signaling complex protein PhoU [Fimbriimonadaceae bacterium]|nr:phosphate signaling complex protein PhoU [Fimbriimonadaceae bacterium]
MHYREEYDSKLNEIKTSVLQMGSIAGEMVKLASEIAITGNADLVAKVQEMDDKIDQMETDIVTESMVTIMRESPVASDLRTLTSTIGVVSEIEKIGDHAVKLAKRSNKLSGNLPAEFRKLLIEMSEDARQMFGSALHLYDAWDADLAESIIASDKEVDDKYGESKRQIIGMIQSVPDSTAHLLRVLRVFQAIEHVADNAVEIAKRMRMHYSH